MQAEPTSVRLALGGAPYEARVYDRLKELYRGRSVAVVKAEAGVRADRSSICLVAAEALAAVSPQPRAVALLDGGLAAVVGLLIRHPWLNHVVTPTIFDRPNPWCACALGKLLSDGPARRVAVFPPTFSGRKVAMRDSAKRFSRLEAMVEHARQEGVRAALEDRIRDVAEELLTNALYDAPAERSGAAISRAERVNLPKDQGCELTYGVTDGLFVIRVIDPFGALTRERLVEVLTRCTASETIDVDSSRGGAGLGLWRIFENASLLVLHVQARRSTEFVVGIDLRRGRRAPQSRAIHLFFEPESEPSDSERCTAKVHS
jgi:hypothetical protein